MSDEIVVKAALYVVPLLFAVMAHEVAHGWVAEKRGDPTARMLGRITLNPIMHVDLFGTVILPALLLFMGSPFVFGWAKPVPVNFHNLRGGRKDMALVSFAGPFTNLVLALLSAALFHLIHLGISAGAIPESGLAAYVAIPVLQMAQISVKLNLVLMVVNLLPVPPLDGGRIMVGLLPYPIALQLERVEPFGMLIVLILIATRFWEKFVHPVLDFFWRLLM